MRKEDMGQHEILVRKTLTKTEKAVFFLFKKNRKYRNSYGYKPANFYMKRIRSPLYQR